MFFPSVTLCNQNRIDCLRTRDILETKCNGNDTDLCPFSRGGLDTVRRLYSAACVQVKDVPRSSEFIYD